MSNMYKYSEDKALSELKEYIDSTYESHYSKNKFQATRYHSLIIDKKNLSNELDITAETSDGIIMGVMHKKYNVHGVQFHPESIKTNVGIKIIKNFLKA